MWGSSCWCHQDEWHKGIPITCRHRGRLVPYAYDFACERIAEIVQEALEWTLAFWDGDADFLHKAVAVVRATASRALQKIEFLDRVPYLFAKLGYNPGIRPRLYAQYAQPGTHQRQTYRFMIEDGELRSAIDVMRDGFDLSNALLDQSVTAIRDLPLNDEVNEKPHAVFSRIHAHAPSSSFAWKASTSRLPQNLDDCYTLSAAASQDLQFHYNTFRQVVQPRNRKRDPKMSRAKFESMFYKCSHAFVPTVGLFCDADPDIHVTWTTSKKSRWWTKTNIF